MDDEVATEPKAPPLPEKAPPLPERPAKAPAGPKQFPWTMIVIAVLLAGLITETFFLFRTNSSDGARAEVLRTSNRFLALLTTYSSTTLDAQRREVLALATGKFKGEYEQLTGSGFLATLRERAAVSTGTVVRSSVESVSGDSATALAVVSVSVTNKDIKTPAVEQDVIEVSLIHTRSGWRIDAVTILGRLTV